jgi:zinc/manganese transport system substrate-binding protein
MRALRTGLSLGLSCLALSAHAGARVRVATLNTVLTEIARQVGGDRVAVVGIVSPGVDPHTFSPSPSDIRALVDADLVLASGLNLEGYLDRLVASAGPSGRIVAVGDALPLALQVPGAGGRAEKDPHWWNSIGNVILASDLVKRELSAVSPEHAEEFAANAEAYEARLRGLSAWVSAEVGRLPPGRRHLVTSHDAFGYFARDYGFSVHAINGLSTESEADARNVAALIELIRRERTRAVFAENSVDPRLVEDLVRETGVRLGGTLYADGLGPPGSGAESVDAMFRHNVTAIVGALAGP